MVECAVGCPKSCAPTCKPSCCFPEYFEPSVQTPMTMNNMSPGHRASGKCSPTCAIYWTQNILDSATGMYTSSQCPSVCTDSACCHPTPEYITLASSCPSNCAPTYQEICCRSHILPKPEYIEPKPMVVQSPIMMQEIPKVKYVPCSAFCAPNFTQECCAKSTVLAPIRV